MDAIMDCSTYSMKDLLAWLSKQAFVTPARGIIEFLLLNPDGWTGHFSGETIDSKGYYRPIQTLVDLAEITGFQLLTPAFTNEQKIIVRMRRLDSTRFWPPRKEARKVYDSDTDYARISKKEEPWFQLCFQQAIQDAGLCEGWNILGIGVNRGDEFALLQELIPAKTFESLHFTGIDIHEPALRQARERFRCFPNFTWHCCDVNQFTKLELEKQDVIIAIDTLQTTGLGGKELIVQLRKHMLKQHGVFILGFPNARYVDGELSYGARMKNYSEPELSLLVKDLFFYRRYLQQQGFKVKITGKYTVFLTAINKE